MSVRFGWLSACLLMAFNVYAQNWTALYGSEIDFDVYREGKKVGQYTTTFTPTDKGWQIDSTMSLSIRAFFVFRYNYRYSDKEVWQGGQLQSIDVEESRNGKIKRFIAQMQGGFLKGDGQSGPVDIKLPALTTTHYNSAVIGQNQVINTLSGALAHYQLKAAGSEQVQTNKGFVDANKYDYSGDIIDTSVWYTPAGQWVKLWFKADDGSGIELCCVHCMK